MIKKIALSVLLSGIALAGVHAQVVATDNYETGTSISYGYTGGSGFGALTYISGTGGGVFAMNAANGGRQIDGNQSLGLFSGSNSQAAGRSITTPVTNGVYSLDARWDITNTAAMDAFTGLNISSGLGGAFNTNEELSLGMVAGNNSQFQITDFTGTHLISVGSDTELRGGIFAISIAFNTIADTYSLTVTDKGTGQQGTASGKLEGATPGAVSAIGFSNLDTDGGTQNLIVDNTVVTIVPEPSILSLLGGSSILGAFMFLRRRRA